MTFRVHLVKTSSAGRGGKARPALAAIVGAAV